LHSRVRWSGIIAKNLRVRLRGSFLMKLLMLGCHHVAREKNMNDIRYVCLSDTHFGADNSLLTNVKSGSRDVDPFRPSPVLEKVVSCLSTLISKNASGAPKPTLILNGDILELALMTDNMAAMAFERFMELAFPESGEALFDPEIIYLPGNHDHHLWETAREWQYANYIQGIALGAYLDIPWHTTNAFSGGVPSLFLNSLLQRHASMKKVSVKTFYPNYG